jgi:basic membrane protein A
MYRTIVRLYKEETTVNYKSMALFLLLSMALLAASCSPAAPAPAPTSGGAASPTTASTAAKSQFQIPEVEKGKFNVAFIYVGPHDDSGWTQAHDIGRLYLEKNVPNVHTAYVELVPEGTESEQVTRALARKGFDAIVATSFGFMDGMEAVSAEFPTIKFLHVSGYKSNGKNFGNMFGAMEDIEYLAGMIAGARAKADNTPKIGYVATFPIPEELRLGNAFAIGIAQTCPECKVDVRWINTWHDPVLEKEGAASLFDGGAQVVMTGADTPANAEVAKDKKKWAVTYDYEGNCKLDSCLTTMYWNWGPIYAKDIKDMIAGTWKGGGEYFDADFGMLGLFGFMEGQKPQPGVPAVVIPLVQAKLKDMLAGKFTRFDVFAGPIKDNQGKTVVPAGEKIGQADLDQFPPGAPGFTCKYCMLWWNQNITAALPKP